MMSKAPIAQRMLSCSPSSGHASSGAAQKVNAMKG